MSERKIQKPVVDEHYVRPQAAWEKMKAARSMRQTVYLYGTTGSGKTTFVMEFLGRRRCCYVILSNRGVVPKLCCGKESKKYCSTYCKK